MKILYVEDNPANLFLVKRVARVGGHDVVNYIDGEEALANYEKDNPDLVLMDIQLAGELSGLQVVERLRARGHRTPIIAVTAYAMIGDRERCLAAGCDDYIAKPLPIPRLVEMLEKFSGQTGAALKTSDTQTARVVITNTQPVVAPPAPPVAPPKPAEDDTAANPTSEIKEKLAEIPALKLNMPPDVEDDETQVMPMVNPLEGLDESPKREP